MTIPPAGILEEDWAATPVGVRAGFLEVLGQLQRQQQENEQLRQQLTALATELADLRERIDRNSRNSSRPPSSDAQGFQPPVRRKGSGRKRGGQQGHPGTGPELLPIERCDAVEEHHPEHCRCCGTHLQGEDPEPLRHQVIEIPPITPLVIEHRLHRLVCPCCGTSTCAELPADVEPSRYGPRLSALVGLLGSAFPLSFGRTQALLDQLAARSTQTRNLLVGKPTTLKDLQASMRPENYSVLQYLVHGMGVFVWRISAGEVEVKNIYVPDLELLVRSLRESLENRPQGTDQAFDGEISGHLYRYMIEPFREKIKTKRLVIIPQGELSQLPFQALRDPASGAFLGEPYELSTAPSATLLLAMKPSPSLSGARLLAIADPSLPHAVAEVRAIATGGAVPGVNYIGGRAYLIVAGHARTVSLPIERVDGSKATPRMVTLSSTGPVVVAAEPMSRIQLFNVPLSAGPRSCMTGDSENWSGGDTKTGPPRGASHPVCHAAASSGISGADGSGEGSADPSGRGGNPAAHGCGLGSTADCQGAGLLAGDGLMMSNHSIGWLRTCRKKNENPQRSTLTLLQE